MSARIGSNKGAAARVALAAAAALLVALALSVPAGAAEIANHPFKKVLMGGLDKSKPPKSLLEDPCGVAVGTVGETYVSDYYRDVIHGPIDIAAPAPCALAIDAEGDLYVNSWHGEVLKYTPNIYPPPGPGEPPLLYSVSTIDTGTATGVAVDPATEDLLVDQGDGIAVYDAPVEAETAPAMTVGVGTLGDAYGVAISVFPGTQGEIYAADAADSTVKVYDPSVSLVNPVRTIDGAGTAQGGFVSLVDSTLITDQTSGDVFVADDTQPGFEHPLAAVDEFNAEGLYRGQLEHTLIDGEPLGMAINESASKSQGEIYVTSGNGTNLVVPAEGGPPGNEQGALYAFGPAGAGHKLTVTRSGTGTGSLASTSAAGIACPAACEAEFNSGKTVTLTATPASGSAFAGWTGGGCSGTGGCQVALGADVTVDAKFEPAPAFHALSDTAGAKQPDGPQAKGGSATLSLGRASALGTGVALLRATVPGPGTLTARAPGLRRAHRHLAHGGRLTLRVHLNTVARRRLSRRGHLALRLSVDFTPTDAGPSAAAAETVNFKQR